MLYLAGIMPSTKSSLPWPEFTTLPPCEASTPSRRRWTAHDYERNFWGLEWFLRRLVLRIKQKFASQNNNFRDSGLRILKFVTACEVALIVRRARRGILQCWIPLFTQYPPYRSCQKRPTTYYQKTCDKVASLSPRVTLPLRNHSQPHEYNIADGTLAVDFPSSVTCNASFLALPIIARAAFKSLATLLRVNSDFESYAMSHK